MKIIAYNVLDGFVGTNDRKEMCSNWISNESPDVLFLNELNGFTPDRLKSYCSEWGHSYSELLVGRSSYLVGICSRYPIVNVKKYYEHMLGHGAIRCEIQGVVYISTHLHPHSVDKRLKDISFLMNEVNSLIANKKDVVFGGDLNSFYFGEHHYYNSDVNKTLDWYRFRASRDEHFGNLIDGQLDFSVTKNIAGVGLMDLFSLKNTGFVKSIKTELGGRDMLKHKIFLDSGLNHKEIKGRIDYIWASDELAKKCTKCYIPHGGDVEEISDHYPMIAEFEV